MPQRLARHRIPAPPGDSPAGRRAEATRHHFTYFKNLTWLILNFRFINDLELVILNN
jgi:hypothetical protein